MSRPHTLIKFKQAQHVLAKVLMELRVSEENDLNYKLDLEFDEQLNNLLERYGYDASEAMTLIARYEAIEASVRRYPEGELAKVYSSKTTQTKKTGNLHQVSSKELS
jgi:hypothetical protein